VTYTLNLNSRIERKTALVEQALFQI